MTVSKTVLTQKGFWHVVEAFGYKRGPKRVWRDQDNIRYKFELWHHPEKPGLVYMVIESSREQRAYMFQEVEKENFSEVLSELGIVEGETNGNQ